MFTSFTTFQQESTFDRLRRLDDEQRAREERLTTGDATKINTGMKFRMRCESLGTWGAVEEARNALAVKCGVLPAVEASEGARRLAARSVPDLLNYTGEQCGFVHTSGGLASVRAALSTGAAEVLFAGLINAACRKAFDAAPNPLEALCTVGRADNYMTQVREVVDPVASLEPAPRGAEMTQADVIVRSIDSYRIARFGRHWVTDEQDLVDAIPRILLALPKAMGAAARRLPGELAAALLLSNATMADGNALFSAAHANDFSGMALNADNFDAAYSAMATQTNEEGTTLWTRPEMLLVPESLRGAGAALLRNLDTRSDPSPIDMLYDPRLDAGLNDPLSQSPIAGNPAAWYLVADLGGQWLPFEVCYLFGEALPKIRSYALDEGNYGIGWDLTYSVAVRPLEYRGIRRCQP